MRKKIGKKNVRKEKMNENNKYIKNFKINLSFFIV